MKKAILFSLRLLLVVLILWSCRSSKSPYPNDELLIKNFKQNKNLFLELIANPENKNLLTSLGIKRLQTRSSEPKLIWYEIWSHDLFGPGGCMKGYAYSDKTLTSIESIDEVITEPCGPEQKELYRRIQGEWYLYYVSSN